MPPGVRGGSLMWGGVGMGITDTDPTRLVVRAQAGDDQARDELIATYLPLLYNIVARALSGHADVDDIVQETLLCVVRDLPDLRAPESFRSWLVAIALRQISTHRHRQRTAAGRTTVIDEATRIPDSGTGLEDRAILHLHVSDQRRQVVEASRWLDPDYRALLSLWWQENAGRLSRGEIAAAMGLTVAHVGVRLQRMREQLELGRTIVAALEADPRCPGLDATIGGWDGRRTSVWRKRIARHTRSCPLCMVQSTEQVPIAWLLSVTLLPVPAGLTAALAAKGLLSGTAVTASGLAAAHTAVGAGMSGAGLQTSLMGKLTHAVAAHPVVGLATGAVLVAGTAVTYGTLPEPAHRPPGVVAAPPSVSPTPIPSVTKATVPLGTWSLESVDEPGRYLTYTGDFALLGRVSASGGEQSRRRATFTVVRGLADRRCVAFRAADGRYLRHYYLRLRLSSNDGTALFREDVTFCPRPGSVAGSVSLQSHNYPGSVLRHRDGGVWLDGSDGTKAFADASSFITRSPRP